MSTLKKRVDWVDYAKGLSIILVVSTHSMFVDPNSGLYSETIIFLNDLVHRVRMPLFFFLSGLFIHKAMTSSIQSFLRFKVSHLLYLYVLWSIIRYLTSTVPEHILLGGADGGLGSIFKIFISPPATLWFIYALLVFMIVTRLTKRAHLVTFITAIILYIVSPYIGINNFDFLFKLISFYPFFLSGYLFSGFTLNKANNFKYYYLLFPAIYFAIVAYLTYIDVSQSRLQVLIFSFAGIVAGIILSLLLTRFSAFSWLSYVGKNTLPIYVMHYFPIGVFRLILPSVIPNQPYLAAIIMIATGVVLPLVVMKIAKKLNMNWLFEIPKVLNTPIHRKTA